jgi:hypothetical protein
MVLWVEGVVACPASGVSAPGTPWTGGTTYVAAAI